MIGKIREWIIINNVCISGNLAKNSELSKTPKGTEVLNFTVCVPRGFKKEDGADFVNCILYGALAPKLEDIYTKGLKVEVKGELRINNTKDSNGNYKTYVNVIVDGTRALEFKGQAQYDHSYGEPDYSDSDSPW